MPLAGAAFLLADVLALFVPVLGMVAGIGANHVRLKLADRRAQTAGGASRMTGWRQPGQRS